MSKVFSIPLFFVLFRETLEASIIISVLLSLVENLVDRGGDSTDSTLVSSDDEQGETKAQRKKRLVRRMKLQIWAGTGLGLLISLAIGGAFIAVFFTTLSDIWAKSEELWVGTFSLIACIIIFIMGLTMLRIDRSKVVWRHKLESAFDKKPLAGASEKEIKEGKGGKWTLFLLPLITVLREGLEAVVFVGGVALGQPGSAIPLAAIVGLVCGLICGYLIYASSSRVNLTIFLVVSTNVLLLLGAGLFSKSVGSFERYKFHRGVGTDVAELGNGPGSYDVNGNVWHLPYGNPENNIDGQGWTVFNAVLGWSNNASYGTILSYIFYWLAVVAALIYMKWSEGRVSLFGYQSAAGKRRAVSAAAKAERAREAEREKGASSDEIVEEKSRVEWAGSGTGSEEAEGEETTAATLLK